MQKIFKIIAGFIVCIVILYLLIFGRALTQDENHKGILLALPKVILSSKAVPIDEKTYLARDLDSFVRAMEQKGFEHVDTEGSAHLFTTKDGRNYVSISRMYSSHFMLFSYPASDER